MGSIRVTGLGLRVEGLGFRVTVTRGFRTGA